MKKDKEIKWVVDSEVTEMFPPQSYEDLEKEIKTLKEKCMDLFNPNMMSDLEQLIFKRKQANYILTNKRKGK